MPEIAPIDHTDHTWKKGPTGPFWLPRCLVRFDYSGTLMSSRKMISQSVGNTHIVLRRIEGLHHWVPKSWISWQQKIQISWFILDALHVMKAEFHPFLACPALESMLPSFLSAEKGGACCLIGNIFWKPRSGWSTWRMEQKSTKRHPLLSTLEHFRGYLLLKSSSEGVLPKTTMQIQNRYVTAFFRDS